MSYHFSKRLDVPFEQAVSRVTEALKREGFGILTDIDVKATMEAKFGEEFLSLPDSRGVQSETRAPRFAARGQDRHDASLQCHCAAARRRSGRGLSRRSRRLHAGNWQSGPHGGCEGGASEAQKSCRGLVASNSRSAYWLGRAGENDSSGPA